MDRSRRLRLALGFLVAAMVADFSRMLGSAQVECLSTGERADHRAAYVSATLAVKPWFDGFVTPPAK